MNDEQLHQDLRRFLRTFGVGAQQAIEAAIREAVAAGSITPDQPVRVKARLDVLGREFIVEEELRLS